MSAAAATRLTQLHGEPESTLVWQAHARDATELPVLLGVIRRLITVTDRGGTALSSGACIGMHPAAGRPITDRDDLRPATGTDRAADLSTESAVRATPATACRYFL